MGRHRRHATNAARQRAYRERTKQRDATLRLLSAALDQALALHLDRELDAILLRIRRASRRRER